MDDAADPRLLRLLDVVGHEFIKVSCPCGRVVEYAPGLLQRLYRVGSDLLVYDLQYRLRCRHCSRRSGFRIAVATAAGAAIIARRWENASSCRARSIGLKWERAYSLIRGVGYRSMESAPSSSSWLNPR
jgi:ribosomal protein L34